MDAIKLEIKFPNEDSNYRSARRELLAAEIELRARLEQVAAMRRSLPPGGPVPCDYVFQAVAVDGALSDIRMSALFEDGKDTLFVYSFMFGPDMERPCPSCSSVLDALNGNARHIAGRINLAVVARSPAPRIQAFAEERGWHDLRMLSSAENSYNADYFSETESGGQMPMANVFALRDGTIRHTWGTEMLYAKLDGQPRHVDLIWPLWNVLDTTPGGRGDWNPTLGS